VDNVKIVASALALGRSVGLALALVAALGLAGLAGPAGAASTGVDVNRATASELEALPGIGTVRARAILEAREARGGFGSVDELVEVKGIGERQLEKLRPLVRVGPRSEPAAR